MGWVGGTREEDRTLRRCWPGCCKSVTANVEAPLNPSAAWRNWQSDMRMTMTAADVVEILGWLAASADVWLDGGWGVDALVGEQTREHKDLDLIVRDAHEHRMREVLATHGFIQVGGVPQFFVLADERGREVEVHPVRFDDQGNGHLLTQEGEPFGHLAEAFAATGSVSGYRVACLSAEAQMSNHSWGYEPGDADVHDMRLLHDRLGTPLMGPYQSV
jgi:lincosamide nucleotidyltransferase A/C/D/E